MINYQHPAAHIRDSLYNLVPLSTEVLAILQQPAFLRLDGIQQLGFASRVWPGAKHTRYEHSIGVMHLTERAVAHLRSLPEGAFIDDDDSRVAIAAALLHDIGHYPFSHAIEELGAPVRSHEDVGNSIVLSEEIAAVLYSTWGVDPRRVAAMIHGDGEHLTDTDRVLRGLLSGTLDMDKLDYLPRDARSCNVPYGGVDTDRLITSLEILRTPDGEQRIGIGGKGVSPLHSLSLTDHHDASLLAMLQEDDMPAETRMLADALALRKIHKRGVEISARARDLYDRISRLWYDPAERRSVELRMVDLLRGMTDMTVGNTAILLDIPKPEKWKTDVWVTFDRPPVGMQSLMHWQDVVGVTDADFKRYEEHRRLIRVVADRRVVDIVRSNWEQLLLPALGGMRVERADD